MIPNLLNQETNQEKEKKYLSDKILRKFNKII